MVCETREPYDSETQAWINAADCPEEKYRRKQRAKYLRHKERYKARARERYLADPQKIRANNRRWEENNREKFLSDKLAWEKKFKAENPEKWAAQRHEIYMRRRDKALAAAKKWREEKPHLNAKKQAAYKFRKARATVPWANDFFISEAYELAKLRSEMTGIKWEVDHIMPLCGKDICGLHVETNLQVIPKVINRKKHAKDWHQYIPASHLW